MKSRILSLLVFVSSHGVCHPVTFCRLHGRRRPEERLRVRPALRELQRFQRRLKTKTGEI